MASGASSGMVGSGVLIVFHTSSNAGYAMTSLERMFYSVCESLVDDATQVHFSFTDVSSGAPRSLPAGFDRFLLMDYRDNGTFSSARNYIKKHRIEYALCFDVQPRSKLCNFLRSCGVRRIVAYWGSTISSRNGPLKLLLKKIEVSLSKHRPDHFVFESEAMRELAVFGRGISPKITSVIPTGVDVQKFRPQIESTAFVRSEFGFPDNAQIVFYSGHMEPRKGVGVIVDAAILLARNSPDLPIYFLICGNRPGEERPFQESLRGTRAEERVVFAGYRHDLPRIMPGCAMGVVASVGWDSFPMSTLEMAASGLPIVVSRFQGLIETLEEGVTGYTFEPGNATALAGLISKLASDPALRQEMSQYAVSRIRAGFALQHQFERLRSLLGREFAGS